MNSQKSKWFLIRAPNFWIHSSCVLSDRQVLLTLAKSTTTEGAETVGYATLLVDRERQGFFVLDRIIESATKTPDGASTLFVDEDGILNQIEVRPSIANLDGDKIADAKPMQAGPENESPKGANSTQDLEPESSAADYYRLEIIGRKVDVYNLRLSADGLRSTSNNDSRPVFEVNGKRWEPNAQPLLKPSEFREKLPPIVNFSAAKVHCVSTGPNVGSAYTFTNNGVDIAFFDKPRGAGDCCTVINIPTMSMVAEDMRAAGVGWSEPWSTALYPFTPGSEHEPPTRELLTTLESKAHFQFEKLDFAFLDRLVTEDNQTEALVPPDNFVLAGKRSFKCPDGIYSIECFADHGIRVWIDDVLLIDRWHLQSAAQHYTRENRLAGGEHVVSFEYFESNGLSRLFVDARRVE